MATARRQIGIANLKGGVGKSTTALHLAAALGRRSRPVLVLDGDPLRPLSEWAAGGRLPAFVRVLDEREAARSGAARDAAIVVLDLAGGDAAALERVAGLLDAVIVPASPDALGLAAVRRTLDVLAGRVPARVLLTLVPPAPSTAGAVALEALEGAGLSVCRAQIPRLMAFAEAAAAQCLVGDLPGERAARGAAAYQLLASEVQTWLDSKRRA